MVQKFNIQVISRHTNFFDICNNAPHIFITGTDTNVGKTICSAWLCKQLNANYFKPIQSGISLTYPHTDSDFIRDFMHENALQHICVFPEIYCFDYAVSPHLAAQYAKQNIELSNIILPASKEYKLIIEGAGGIYVPINKKQYMLDVMRHLSLPVIIAARSCLGTINHTLLSIKALRDYSIPILGVILVGDLHAHNKKAIEEYGGVNILAELNFLFDK